MILESVPGLEEILVLVVMVVFTVVFTVVGWQCFYPELLPDDPLPEELLDEGPLAEESLQSEVRDLEPESLAPFPVLSRKRFKNHNKSK